MSKTFLEVCHQLFKLNLLEDLKPCPFCGSKADYLFGEQPEENPIQGYEWVAVGCPNCDIRTCLAYVDIMDDEIVKRDTIFDKIIQWNKRV